MSTEYQREYRARFGGSSPADRARARADSAAAVWLRHNMPEVYGNLLAQARASLGMSTEIGPAGTFTPAIKHGTPNGYSAHRYRNEPPCNECRLAYNRSVREAKAKRRAS